MASKGLCDSFKIFNKMSSSCCDNIFVGSSLPCTVGWELEPYWIKFRQESAGLSGWHEIIEMTHLRWWWMTWKCMFNGPCSFISALSFYSCSEARSNLLEVQYLVWRHQHTSRRCIAMTSNTKDHSFKRYCIQVVPGRAGGGSFKRKKNYIAKKEFAYRMCARWPTIAMSKFFSEVWTKLLPLHGCHVMRFGVMCLWFDLLSNDVASCEVICGTTPTYYSSTTLYSVLQSTTPVLLCTTKYYSSTTLQYYNVLLCTTKYYSSTTLYYKVLLCTTKYYKVLLQYYSVLQSTTPVLLCTTPVLQRTTLYYQVLQSTTPVLLCTTKYYSSTTLYYKVLRQYYSYYKVLLRYYSVLQSTTPVLLCTTQYYNVLLCTAKYYNVLLQYYSVLQSTTPVPLCTTKYYASTTKYYASTTLYYKVLQRTTPVLLQYYSVLQSTTPVLLSSTTTYYSVLQSTTKYYSSTTLYYKVLLQYYSVLQSTTPVLLCTTKYYSGTTLYYKVLQRTTPVLLCTTKYYSSTTLYYKVLRQYYSVLRQYYNLLLRYYFETSFTMRGATRVSVQLHQILRLPRKMNVINDLRHIWNVISNAWSKSSHPPTSPNTAPTTKSWSSRFQRILPECFRQ